MLTTNRLTRLRIRLLWCLRNQSCFGGRSSVDSTPSYCAGPFLVKLWWTPPRLATDWSGSTLADDVASNGSSWRRRATFHEWTPTPSNSRPWVAQPYLDGTCLFVIVQCQLVVRKKGNILRMITKKYTTNLPNQSS